MNNTGLIARLSALLLLAGCCDNNDNDCTVAELAQKNADRQYWHQKATVPELVTETDGIKLYRIWTIEPSRLQDHWTYFTTPCGDVNAELTWNERRGKTHETKHQQISTPGGGCK